MAELEFQFVPIGTEVIVYVNAIYGELLVNKNYANAKGILATVINHRPTGYATTIATKKGQPHPTEQSRKLTQDQIDQGFDWVYEYANYCMCNTDTSSIVPIASNQVQNSSIKRIESPCKSCAKPNDQGVKSCWWCGNNPC